MLPQQNNSLTADRIAELTAQASQIVKLVPSAITSAEDVAKGQVFCKQAGAFCKQVEFERMAVSRVLDDAKKKLIETERNITASVLEAVNGVNKAMTAYLTEQERLRKEQEAKAAAELKLKQTQAENLAKLKGNILGAYKVMTAENCEQYCDLIQSTHIKEEL